MFLCLHLTSLPFVTPWRRFFCFPFSVLVSSCHLFLTWSLLFKKFLHCFTLHFLYIVLLFPLSCLYIPCLHICSIFCSSSVCRIHPRANPERLLPALLSIMSHGLIEIAPLKIGNCTNQISPLPLNTSFQTFSGKALL